MPTVLKRVMIIISVIVAPIAVFAGGFSALEYVARCEQHSTVEARSITSKLRELLRKNGSFSIHEIVDRPPIFYCFAAHKADFADLQAFASRINYKIPHHKFYCGAFSYKPRIILFFDGSVLDAQVPTDLPIVADESAVACFKDPSARYGGKL